MDATTAFALAACLHAGFQMTVTAVVYPALAEVDGSDVATWDRAHERHSRRIVGVVGLVYGLLAVTGAVLLLHGPSAWGWAALALTAVTVAVTAFAAAPVHGKLGATERAGREGRDDDLVRTLLRADRVRAVTAVLAALAAVVALL